MWPNPQETVDLNTFTEKILNEKLDFLCSEISSTKLAPVQYHEYQINTKSKLSE